MIHSFHILRLNYKVLFVCALMSASFSAHADKCQDAKAEALYYFRLYMQSMLLGLQGASVPGAEGGAALERAKKICKKPDLTFEMIFQEGLKELEKMDRE